jgi:3-dehydroquinate dehydratase-2
MASAVSWPAGKQMKGEELMGNDDKKQRIIVIHGPNLNMLGTREPDFYGRLTLNDINVQLLARGHQLGVEVDVYQSNHEGDIVTRIQDIVGHYDGLIINPAAYTHTSIAIRDAILLLDIPVIEIHLSNIYKRESFRHHSMLADIVTGQISGLGTRGYLLALDAISKIISEN